MTAIESTLIEHQLNEAGESPRSCVVPKNGNLGLLEGGRNKTVTLFQGGALAKIREELPFETQVFDKYLREDGREIRDMRNNKRKRRECR